MKLKTIAELHAKVKSGEIDESKLLIVLDNDSTSFRVGDDWEDENANIEVAEADGYYDIEKLYPLLFPKATVEWC